MPKPRDMATRLADTPTHIVREHQDQANLESEPATEYRCIWCHAWKPVEDFRKDNSHSSRRQRRCKSCDNIYAGCKAARRRIRRAKRLDAAGVTVVHGSRMSAIFDDHQRGENAYQEAKRIVQDRIHG